MSATNPRWVATDPITYPPAVQVEDDARGTRRRRRRPVRPRPHVHPLGRDAARVDRRRPDVRRARERGGDRRQAVPPRRDGRVGGKGQRSEQGEDRLKLRAGHDRDLLAVAPGRPSPAKGGTSVTTWRMPVYYGRTTASRHARTIKVPAAAAPLQRTRPAGPARVVYNSSGYLPDERAGFSGAIEAEHVEYCCSASDGRSPACSGWASRPTPSATGARSIRVAKNRASSRERANALSGGGQRFFEEQAEVVLRHGPPLLARSCPRPSGRARAAGQRALSGVPTRARQVAVVATDLPRLMAKLQPVLECSRRMFVQSRVAALAPARQGPADVVVANRAERLSRDAAKPRSRRRGAADGLRTRPGV